MEWTYMDKKILPTTFKTLRHKQRAHHVCIGNTKVVLQGPVKLQFSLGKVELWNEIKGNLSIRMCRQLKMVCLFCKSGVVSSLNNIRQHLESAKHKRNSSEKIKQLSIDFIEISVCQLCVMLLLGGKQDITSNCNSQPKTTNSNQNVRRKAVPDEEPFYDQNKRLKLGDEKLLESSSQDGNSNNTNKNSNCQENKLEKDDEEVQVLEAGQYDVSNCPETNTDPEVINCELSNSTVDCEKDSSNDIQCIPSTSTSNSCSEVVKKCRTSKEAYDVIELGEIVSDNDSDVQLLESTAQEVIDVNDSSESDSVEYVRMEKNEGFSVNISTQNVETEDHQSQLNMIEALEAHEDVAFHNCISKSYLLCAFSNRHEMRRGISDSNFLHDEFESVNKNTLVAICKVCDSCSMFGFSNLISHLLGSKHDKAERQTFHPKRGFLKLVACRKCAKIVYYYDAFNASQTTNPQETLKQVLDNAHLLKSVKEDVTTNDQTDGAPRKMLKPARDVSFYIHVKGLQRDLTLLKIFKGIQHFGETRTLTIQFLFINWDRNFLICCFKKRRNSVVPDARKCYISNKLYYVSQMSAENAFNHLRQQEHSTLWRDGDMSPECSSILNDPSVLLARVASALQEMSDTARNYNRLTNIIGDDLFNRMNMFYEVESIDFFGSRTTGTAISDSDFDIALCINHSMYDRAPNISDVADVLGSDRLRRFRICSVIKFAKVPIVKVTHSGTQSKCDISLNNLGGVFNSKLTRFYLDIDTRIRWLVCFIKEWALLNNIRGSFRITSYSLTWLVIFYLMQKHVALVPPVHFLTSLPGSQRLQPPTCQFSFCIRDDVLKQFYKPGPGVNFTELQLLYGFFKYYSTFDLKRAIFPFTGQPVDRGFLRSRMPPLLGPTNMTEQKLAAFSLIVVDPIDHFVNIAPAVDKEVASTFQHLCKKSMLLMDAYLNNNEVVIE